MKVLNPTDFYNVENYSKILKDKIKLSFENVTEILDYYNTHVFSVDLVDDVLKELHDKYGIEENNENFIKLKTEIYHIIACKMMDIADSLYRMARKYRVK